MPWRVSNAHATQLAATYLNAVKALSCDTPNSTKNIDPASARGCRREGETRHPAAADDGAAAGLPSAEERHRVSRIDGGVDRPGCRSAFARRCRAAGVAQDRGPRGAHSRSEACEPRRRSPPRAARLNALPPPPRPMAGRGKATAPTWSCRPGNGKKAEPGARRIAPVD
jgi:hypothetical protein